MTTPLDTFQTLWRELFQFDCADLERDKKFVVAQKLVEGAYEVFINGDSSIPNAKARKQLFRKMMVASVEV